MLDVSKETTHVQASARYHQGIVQASATKSLRMSCSPNQVEALGLKWCLKWIKTQNLQNVVEMDAADVVNCIMGKLNIVEINFVVADCLDILFKFIKCKCCGC